jgi:HD superfamily phosphodiesterase
VPEGYPARPSLRSGISDQPHNHGEAGTWQPRRLPAEADRLCREIRAPERLVRHLRLVHDAAASLLEELTRAFPTLSVDARAVLIGAAVHDLGKALHPEELSGPGNLHERDGPALLERHGLEPSLARFARTHGGCDSEPVEPEDLLVCLADRLWRGVRDNRLEGRIVLVLADRCGIEAWEAFERFDRIAERVASGAESRLAWQAAVD